VKSLAFCAALALGLLARLDPAAAQADVALVLAVDVSGSVSDQRFQLQRDGIANALDSDELAGLVSNGSHQAIEIAVVEWAEEQQLVVPWTVIRSRQDLAGVAARLRHSPRSWVHTMTDPAGGIAAADALFASLPLVPDRRVIDVSGDGKQNKGTLPTRESRDAAVARGVTVNGLPITSGDEPDVGAWYRANVVGGNDAFLVVANGFEAFAEAFRQKLTREVAGNTVAQRLALAR
jgi:Protein of unknown function (DUF1194)